MSAKNDLWQYKFKQRQLTADIESFEEHLFLYRVADATTAARYIPNVGIFASAHIQNDSNNPMQAYRESQADVSDLDKKKDLLNHMDWYNDTGTRLISCTLSLPWAIMEAQRRQFFRGMDPEYLLILAISMASVKGRAALATKRLISIDPDDDEGFQSLASYSQEALVDDYIPDEAIIACTSLQKISPIIPSWFCKLNSKEPLNLEESKVHLHWAESVRERFKDIASNSPDWRVWFRKNAFKEAVDFATTLVQSKIVFDRADEDKCVKFQQSVHAIAWSLSRWPLLHEKEMSLYQFKYRDPLYDELGQYVADRLEGMKSQMEMDDHAVANITGAVAAATALSETVLAERLNYAETAIPMGPIPTLANAA